MKMWVQSLASVSDERIWCCHELQYRLQTWLISQVAGAVAVVQAGSHSSNLISSWVTTVYQW